MRLVTWNCFRGECLARAGEVSDIAPDVLVLQECARPEGADPTRVQWFGENPRHGMGILAGPRHRLVAAPVAPSITHSVFPVFVEDVAAGTRTFVLGVWAMPDPTYVASVVAGIEAYAPLLREHPSVVMGDFNSHPRFDRGNARHARIVDCLRELGLVSAYHAAEADRVEVPTHFWKWNAANGMHIDYCFIPEGWRPHLRGATVLDEPPRSRRSDHRPLIVDLDFAPAGQQPAHPGMVGQ
jgi:endonuclease/exonuclease/phosphatase family metal-dependent hydrolase